MKLLVIKEILSGLLASRIILKVHNSQPHHFSHLFVVPKKDAPNRLRTLLPEHPPGCSYLQNGTEFGDCLWYCPSHLEMYWTSRMHFYHVPMIWAFQVFLAFVDGKAFLSGPADWPVGDPLGLLQDHRPPPSFAATAFTPFWTVSSSLSHLRRL